MHMEPAYHSHDVAMVESQTNKREYLKFGGVLLVIAVCATVMSTVLGFDWQEWMRWFMGGFFIIFGSFKLIGYEMFITMFPIYDPLARRFKLYNYAYPFIELFLGFLYVANLLEVPRDIVTIVLLGIGAYGVSRSISANNGIKCACLGNIIKLPLSSVTLFEDVLMVAMAAIMLISYFVV